MGVWVNETSDDVFFFTIHIHNLFALFAQHAGRVASLLD
jgi:hypothetical protein